MVAVLDCVKLKETKKKKERKGRKTCLDTEQDNQIC